MGSAKEHLIFRKTSLSLAWGRQEFTPNHWITNQTYEEWRFLKEVKILTATALHKPGV